MKKNSIFKVSILAILVIGLASCTTAPNFGRPELTDKPLTPTSTLTSDVPNRLIRDGAIRVGAVLPLSTKEGKLIKNALELAVGNNSGAKIILFTENSGDSRSSGAARSAARKLLAKGVEIIIGPIRSSNVRAVANEARAFGVPVIAFSQDINAAGNGVYLQTILREDEIRRVVKHSAARGFTKFASLTPKNPLGRIVASTFKSSANRYGSLVASATYSPYSAKSTQAQKIQFIKDIKRFAAQANSAKANAILLPESPAANRHIAKVLKGVGFKNTGVKFLGTSLWSKPGTSGISILSGGWYANTNAIYSFNSKYAEYAGKTPTTNRAALAYDAMSLVAQLGRAAPIGQRFAPSAFANPGGYRGVLGHYNYSGRGYSSYDLKITQVGG